LKKEIEKVILIVAYPAVMFGGLGLHYFFQYLNLSLVWSTYLPILFGVIAIILLENAYPFHRAWLPNKKDVKNDLLFLVIIQAALPKLILYLAFLSLVESGFLTVNFLNNAWPHHWHYLSQALFMIVIIDFMIYWVHRGLHAIPWLWRFHAVHHSPHKLYWLNVGRDHPVEKILLFTFGLLPFHILGVNEKTFAFYFVIFDMHAFLQHSNINIKYGFFNYIISTSELHRWHHSRKVTLAEHNYGNTLSLWDVLFKTWYFPYADYYDIGVKNKNYPLGFFSLMSAPFVKDITNRNVPLPDIKAVLLRFIRIITFQRS
jgi:sterol desaturase/sphingolipid hydroxylase (fatty acid hydroxylase superfamily)